MRAARAASGSVSYKEVSARRCLYHSPSRPSTHPSGAQNARQCLGIGGPAKGVCTAAHLVNSQRIPRPRPSLCVSPHRSDYERRRDPPCNCRHPPHPSTSPPPLPRFSAPTLSPLTKFRHIERQERCGEYRRGGGCSNRHVQAQRRRAGSVHLTSRQGLGFRV
jgi:hypothetical protein